MSPAHSLNLSCHRIGRAGSTAGISSVIHIEGAYSVSRRRHSELPNRCLSVVRRLARCYWWFAYAVCSHFSPPIVMLLTAAIIYFYYIMKTVSIPYNTHTLKFILNFSLAYLLKYYEFFLFSDYFSTMFFENYAYTEQYKTSDRVWVCTSKYVQ